jgi:predicted membrane channel-forming protein YqfA (hemolysin III family)
MAMLLVHWIAACAAILGLLVLAPRSAQPFEANPWIALAGFLIFPQLMIQFTLMERSAKRPPAGTGAEGE